MLRISDELYEAIAVRAKEDQRSISMMGSLLLGAALNRDLGHAKDMNETLISMTSVAAPSEMDELMNKVKAGGDMWVPQGNEGIPTGAKKLPDHLIGRSRAGIRAEIDGINELIREEIANNQDAESQSRKVYEWNAQIQVLWAEYHELKGE